MGKNGLDQAGSEKDIGSYCLNSRSFPDKKHLPRHTAVVHSRSHRVLGGLSVCASLISNTALYGQVSGLLQSYMPRLLPPLLGPLAVQRLLQFGFKKQSMTWEICHVL